MEVRTIRCNLIHVDIKDQAVKGIYMVPEGCEVSIDNIYFIHSLDRVKHNEFKNVGVDRVYSCLLFAYAEKSISTFKCGGYVYPSHIKEV